MRELSLNNCRLDKRYDIRELLGRGSYAEVYLARDVLAATSSQHSFVVIKALNVFLQDDLDADLERTLVENFQNEAIALDRVRHPNIISRIGHGTARDLEGTVFHYIVLEYLSGGDLQNALRNHDLPVNRAMAYIGQLCSGLGHAHSRGIIHRDIKPQNILLTGDLLSVKIADFGVARIHLSESPITRVGTNVYAPPEHSPMLSGQTGLLSLGKLTPAADIYSLAKTVYALVTGEAPRLYVNNAITNLPDVVRNEVWADELIRVLRKATMVDPRGRHQSVEEFREDLSGVREIVEDGEAGTVLRTRPLAASPMSGMPKIDYSTTIPGQPHFQPVSDPAVIAAPGVYGMRTAANYRTDETAKAKPPLNSLIQYDFPQTSGPITSSPDQPADVAAVQAIPKKKRNAFRRLMAFAIFLCLFTGILYGTAVYMRGRAALPEIWNPFKVQTATANTDINLRPGPSADNDPIGLVTKNSKVRIVKSENNWYQVDIIEQGRGANSANTRGWLNGKYLDIDNN